MNKIRRLIRIFIALSIAFLINHYCGFSHEWWLPVATFFVMLTNTGSAIYQGILRYILLLLVVGSLSWLLASSQLMHMRIYDISIGAAIGILVNSLVFPDHVDVEFRKAIIPVLMSSAEYFTAIINFLLLHHAAEVDAKKLMLEKKLRQLPYWVYETGFDLALQKGYRYFVMKLNEVSEILFSMHHLARYPFPNELLEIIKEPLLNTLHKGEQFFLALRQVLNLQTVTGDIVDFYHDIQLIEDQFKKIIPLQLEILDIQKDAVYLIEFIYNLRELQDTLIKMAEALRAEIR